jgi:hypothetical protein
MSLIFATQLTAVATLALAILAFFTAIFALGAFWAQYRQLKDQFLERKREAGERRSAQAVQVYMWRDTTDTQNELAVHIRNTSQQPIYNVQLLNMPDRTRRSQGPVEPRPPGATAGLPGTAQTLKSAPGQCLSPPPHERDRG